MEKVMARLDSAGFRCMKQPFEELSSRPTPAAKNFKRR